MRVFSAEDLDRTLDFPALIDELAEAMRGGFVAPHRHHHLVQRAGEPVATHLLMPAWTESASRAGLYLGVKVVNVFPGNAARGLPAVTGRLRAAVGPHRRDARSDRRDAPHPLAHRGRLRARRAPSRADGREAPADRRRRRARAVSRAGACERATLRTDRAVEPSSGGREETRRPARRVRTSPPRRPRTSKPRSPRPTSISCATLATEPLIAGRWLKAGQHLDLVGAFTVSMREADDEALRRAHIFIDTDAALVEGGDVAAGDLGRRHRPLRGDRRSAGALPRRAGTAPRRRDHPLQVGRRGDRGPRCGDSRVAEGGRRGAVSALWARRDAARLGLTKA